MTSVPTRIPRERTAIGRIELSRPLRYAIDDRLITGSTSVLDYGCGRGDDLVQLQAHGIACEGWDPNYRPDGNRDSADVVNLGYVINVIEDRDERAACLRAAWECSKTLLIVSARLAIEARFLKASQMNDGCLTKRGTFQKFYEQSELASWLEQVLGRPAISAAPGIFYIFRDPKTANAYVAERCRRPWTLSAIRSRPSITDEQKSIAGPLVEFVRERARFPDEFELPNTSSVVEKLGGLRRSVKLVEYIVGSAEWDAARRRRQEDLLLFLAISRFRRRPPWKDLPRALQLDIKAFFQSYRAALELADANLFSLGSSEFRDGLIRAGKIGKTTQSALYVHESAIPFLDLPLRLFEACAREFVGRVDEANIVKFHRGEAKISYLSYPEFMKDPHPALRMSLMVGLQTFQIEVRHYDAGGNPPILHRKELFLSPNHPMHAKFTRLTRREESLGLFDGTNIGTQNEWQKLVRARGLRFRGHRVSCSLPMSQCDPSSGVT